METSWQKRGTYGNILKILISKQLTTFEKEDDTLKKIKIAQNIGYLCQVQTSLIREGEDLVQRIDKLEKFAGLVQKEKLTK